MIDDIFLIIFCTWLFGMLFNYIFVINEYPKKYDNEQLVFIILYTPIFNICFAIYQLTKLFYTSIKEIINEYR